MSGIFVEKILSHNTETFRTGTLPCCVSENFLLLKSLWIRGGGVSRFSVDNFLSHSAETFHREPFSVNNIVYCGFATNLAALAISKSDNIPVPYASLRSLILLLSSFELRLFSHHT